MRPLMRDAASATACRGAPQAKTSEVVKTSEVSRVSSFAHGTVSLWGHRRFGNAVAPTIGLDDFVQFVQFVAGQSHARMRATHVFAPTMCFRDGMCRGDGIGDGV